MRFRTTLIVAVLLALFGAYAYFIEYKGTEKKKQKEEQQKTLLEIKKEDVSEIGIDGLPQTVKILPAPNDVWQLTSPFQARADESTVNRILEKLEKLKYAGIIEEQPKSLAPYELDQPKLVIHVTLKKSNARKTLAIGGKNPVGDLYYIRVNNDPRVYAVEASVGDIASTTLFDLRDKKLTDFSSDKVEALRFHTAKLDLELQKESGVWKMKKPVPSPAADGEISSLLSSLEFLRATEFIDQPSADLSPYGLKDPAAFAEIRLEKGLRQKILFGKKEGDQLYCRTEGSSSIAKVSDSFSNYFEKELNNWREKKLIVFNRFDAEEVRIKTGRKEYLFKKGKEEKWTEESPAKGEIESEKIQELLEKLEMAEIVNYGDQANLESSPVMEVLMTLRDWQDKVTKKHLSFGSVQANLQAVKNDEYNTIVFANGSLHQQLEKALAEITPKTPATIKTK